MRSTLSFATTLLTSAGLVTLAGLAAPAVAQTWGWGVGVGFGAPIYAPPPPVYAGPPPGYYEPPVLYAPPGPPPGSPLATAGNPVPMEFAPDGRPVFRMESADAVLARLDAAGYSEFSPMNMRGHFYVLAAVDPRGDLVQLEISIFSGEIEQQFLIQAGYRQRLQPAPPPAEVAVVVPPPVAPPAVQPAPAAAPAPAPAPAPAAQAAPPASPPPASGAAPTPMEERLIPPPEEQDPLVVY